jgi:uncharacterized membrane protein YagU involved in acid resistance
MTPSSRDERSFLRAVLLGGSIGGALDILFAISFAGVYGVGPVRVLQTVGSGLLGDAAFAGGAAAAITGFVCHFLLSWLWAALFVAAALRHPALVRRPLVAAIVLGIVVFLAMRLVVLPLSAYPRPVRYPPLASALDLASHMFLVAGPIVWAASRAVGARAARRAAAAGASPGL